tara:strand:- start:117 stop:554 length:438 start_codon:yes stop_codon:yes gene_type:complete
VKNLARGYIASGEFNGYRTPQHLQNQIVKAYCDFNDLTFVLSRAEYWIDGNTNCQLWAALKEGFRHIVFFSIWQLPVNTNQRAEIYDYCETNDITLHFATERICIKENADCIEDLEVLIKSNLIMLENTQYQQQLDALRKLLQKV